MHAPHQSSGFARYLLFLLLLFGTGCGRGADMAAASAPESPQVAQTTEPAQPASDEFLAAEDSAELELQSLSTKSTSRDESAAPPPRAPSPARPATSSPESAGIAVKGLPGEAVPAPQQSAQLAATADKAAPLLIYGATLTMAVFGTAPALDAVEALARRQRGYLVKRSDTSITVRVPADAFEQTLAGVSKLGDELHRDVSVRDVTEEFTDLEVRLRNAEVVRQRLEALLAKAGSVEDALAVERELARLTQSIELWKGKLKLFRELVAFSTITVNFQVRSVEHVKSDVALPFDWLRQLGLSNLLSL